MAAVIPSRLALTGAVFSILLLGCGDDLTEVPEPEPGKPYCMIVTDTWGYFADGSKQYVLGPNMSPAACACTPQENRWDPEFLDELNTLAWDFIHDECREDYESGYWKNVVWYVGEGSEATHFKPPELHCADG